MREMQRNYQELAKIIFVINQAEVAIHDPQVLWFYIDVTETENKRDLHIFRPNIPPCLALSSSIHLTKKLCYLFWE